MRFFRFVAPLPLALAVSIAAGTLSSAALAQQPSPPGNTPPVTEPPVERAPPQPLPPLERRTVPNNEPHVENRTAPAPQQGKSEQAATPADSVSPREKVDGLLAQLKREGDPDKAKNLAEEIQSGWSESGSPTVDLLLQWASEAVEKKNNGAALDFLDRATIIAPDFTGAWHQRATLHYTMGDPRKAMADINEVLKREPRHFGAIAGMAAILMDAEEDALAEKALAQYLSIYPADRQAREQLQTLSEKIAGSRT